MDVLHPPPANYTVTIIADWITAKEELEKACTPESIIGYQSATTTLLNDPYARSVMTQLLRANAAHDADFTEGA